MRKITVHEDWSKLRLRIGERVELFGRVWVYGETKHKDGTWERFLEPVR